MDEELRKELASLPAGIRKEIEKIYREDPDTRGKSRYEVTNPPMPGSRRYPWLRRTRPSLA